MATKEYATTLWKNLSQGLDTLYQKYKTLREASKLESEAKQEALKPRYDALRSSAATQSRIAKQNTALSLAEKGLGASGEAIRRDALQNAALQQNLTDIDLTQAQEKRELENEKLQADAALSADESEAVAKYIYQMNDAYFTQIDRDRDQALAEEDLKLEKEKAKTEKELREKELQLKVDQLAFEKEKARASAAKSSSGSGSNTSAAGSSASSGGVLGVGGSNFLGNYSPDAFSPDSVSPKQFVSDVIDRYTQTDHRGTKVYDTQKIGASLRLLLGNDAVSKDYRYEVYLYAHALGYL